VVLAPKYAGNFDFGPWKEGGKRGSSALGPGARCTKGGDQDVGFLNIIEKGGKEGKNAVGRSTTGAGGLWGERKE